MISIAAILFVIALWQGTKPAFDVVSFVLAFSALVAVLTIYSFIIW